jgi:outer membrane protein assembly factor BamB
MNYRTAMVSTTWALVAGVAFAADWPQFRGPDRTEISKESGLLTKFPTGGPKLLWTFDQAGMGYSGPAIVGQRLYSCGADEDKDKEFVFAIDVVTGKEAWRTPIARALRDPKFNSDWGGGPRCTPTVDGDRLFYLGAQGDLACLETKSGKLIWQKSLIKDFNGRVMKIWGYSESPLVDGDKLVCCPGGEEGTVAAFNKADGTLLWRSKDWTDDASYASIMPATIAGIKQYIVKSDKATAGVSPVDGKVLWKEALGVNGIATIPTAIVSGDTVFTTCSYRQSGGTCGLIKLTKTEDELKPSIVWKDSNLFNHHGGVVLLNGHLYGHSDGDRKNNMKAGWVCIELATGKEVWQSDKQEKGSLTYADGKLFCWGEKKDELVMIDASPKGWTEHGRFTPPKKSPLRKSQGGYWTHPVVANGKLYLRDQELLFCYDVTVDMAEN